MLRIFQLPIVFDWEKTALTENKINAVNGSIFSVLIFKKAYLIKFSKLGLASLTSGLNVNQINAGKKCMGIA